MHPAPNSKMWAKAAQIRVRARDDTRQRQVWG